MIPFDLVSGSMGTVCWFLLLNSEHVFLSNFAECLATWHTVARLWSKGWIPYLTIDFSQGQPIGCPCMIKQSQMRKRGICHCSTVYGLCSLFLEDLFIIFSFPFNIKLSSLVNLWSLHHDALLLVKLTSWLTIATLILISILRSKTFSFLAQLNMNENLYPSIVK